VAAEVARNRKTDESRLEVAETQVKEFQRRYEREAQEKAALAGELDSLRKLHTHSTRLKETESLLAQRETEIETLKRKLKDNKTAGKDLEAQLAQSVTQTEELQGKLASRECELAELKERLTTELPVDAENAFQSRLSQYREEQIRLRTALRKAEAEIVTITGKLGYTQNKLTSEKCAFRKLGEDMENITNAYDQAMRQNKALLQQTKELEAREAGLASQLQAQLHSTFLSRSELQLVTDKTLTQASIVNAQKTLIAELEGSRTEALAAVVSSI
jgi:chromosome segregation ATPase